ncbi:TRAP transporter substrate-binding protein DctP [Microbulbifer sp. S227A]|uniref:TRAP transporter substrate-binding protein DctP n=1 Tax=Microbulbifer sp. S227A TaxID=3415131 RepID=UPI003C7A3F65
MKLRRLLAAVGTTLVMATAATAETVITYNNFTPPTHFSWEVLRDWAAQVEEKSEGRIRIEFPAKSVAPPPKVLDAVRKGAADAGYMANVFAQKFAPGTGMTMTPWMHRGDAEAAGVALWEVYQEHFIDKDNWKGVELLGLFHFANANMCSVDGAPLDSVAALQERKVWALPGTTAALLKALDISVSSGPAVQIQELVSRNVVDAYAGITYDAIDKFGAGPYTKYCIDFEAAPTSTNFSHFISSRVWKRLSPQDQQVLRDLSGEHLARMMGRAINAAQAASKAKLRESGVDIQTPTPELLAGLKEGSKPVIATWIASVGDYDVDGMAILEQVRARIVELTDANAGTN